MTNAVTTHEGSKSPVYCLQSSSQPPETVSVFIGLTTPSWSHPPPIFFPPENTVCTSGGDPDLALGRAARLWTHRTLYACIYVCMCALRVPCDPDSQMLLITNSWWALASTNRMSLLVVTLGGGRN